MEFITIRIISTGELLCYMTRENILRICETPIACLENWSTVWLLTNEGKLFSVYDENGEVLDPERYSDEELEILNRFKNNKDK